MNVATTETCQQLLGVPTLFQKRGIFMRGLFLGSNFHFLFTHSREKERDYFGGPQDLILVVYIIGYQKLEEGGL